MSDTMENKQIRNILQIFRSRFGDLNKINN